MGSIVAGRDRTAGDRRPGSGAHLPWSPMSSYDETQSEPTFPRPADQPDPAAPIEAPAPGETDDQGDENDETEDDDADPDAGVIGTAGIADLNHCAELLGQLGRAARNRFGDRIVHVADEIRALAHEARRRLAADRLPDDAGTDDQQDRVDDEHDRRRAAVPVHETVEGPRPP